MRPRQARLGAILVAASFAWFLLEWNNPAAGSAFVFTIGLVLYAAAPPLVAHAMLAYPDGRVSWWPGLLGLALASVSAVLVLGVLAAPALAEEVAAAARLALENERLQAEAWSQLEDLRASRARIVGSGDAERRRLVRDLHDGAQQRLVTLSLALRLARARLGPGLDPALAGRLDEAEDELRAALADLRELAQGIFPVILAEEGLSAAIEALAETGPAPLEITALPGERLGSSAEAAAYFVVSEAVRQAAASMLKVSVARCGTRLVVEVEGDRAPAEIVGVQDRVGALDGSVTVVRGPGGRATIRAEIPCES